MRFYWLPVGVLCVWRLTYLFYAEDGPWDLLARLRRAAGDGFWGGLLDCFYCLSLWISTPFAYLLGGALTSSCCSGPLFRRAPSCCCEPPSTSELPPALYYEEPEDVLRPSKS